MCVYIYIYIFQPSLRNMHFPSELVRKANTAPNLFQIGAGYGNHESGSAPKGGRNSRDSPEMLSQRILVRRGNLSREIGRKGGRHSAILFDPRRKLCFVE